MIHKALFRLAAASLLCAAGSALAQTSAWDRQLSRVDLGVSGAGEFNRQVSGPVLPLAPNQGANVTQFASNTLGALVDLRYIARPYVGFEFNFGYSRYTENYSTAPGQIQTGANEYTLGYVVTPAHTIFGLQPFASVGAGTIEFKPTAHGGQGAPKQARMTYYYSVGVQQELFQSHFGLRAGFRQLFFLAPDFGQNYLTIKQRTITSEPTAGFYLRF